MRALDCARICVLGVLILGTVGASATPIPEKPDKLVMHIWPGKWGEAMNQVAAAFFAKTGIRVIFDTRDDEPMSTLIVTAIRQGRTPPVDICYTVDALAYKSAVLGMADTLLPEEVPNLALLMPITKPASGRWDYVNVAIDVETVLYRKSAFPDGPPEHLSVMLDPKFKGRVFLENASTNAIFMVALMNGWKVPEDMDKIWTVIESKLKAQNPLLGEDPEGTAAFQRNEVDLAFTYPALVLGLHDPNLRVAQTKEGNFAYFESVFVPRGLPAARAYWAKQFVNELLSTTTLKTYCDALGIPCLENNLGVPVAAKNDPSFPATAADFSKIATLAPQIAMRNVAAWDARFAAIMR